MVRTQERLRAGGRPYWGRAGHRPEAAYLVARGIEYALARNTVNGFLERELTQITCRCTSCPSKRVRQAGNTITAFRWVARSTSCSR